jgi:hypothetical protein
MTISAFDDINHGCQCDFVVDEGSTLEVTSDFDLTGANPSLDLKELNFRFDLHVEFCKRQCN